ncbi:hypothetical protein SEA_WEASELS2_282 [Rhodococcus phage Weasels2]|uniref:Uncharacterized protein n=1 Tax=Rhodococcus phage Weasels2 TaxID=1897437 RepID=A0A1I9SAQ4_9CAUD|nr:hypothetical protein FDH04_gp134 [Rhodococcus phage Weasels2]AOZ63860.1 hypothetical protein SEA_WEASELS2_282 [Rhodococcus phage Weasels2]
MYLTTLNQYFNKDGESVSETYHVEQFESDQQAIENLEKNIYHDLWIVPGFQNRQVDLIVKGTDYKQAKTVWNHRDGYVLAINVFTLTQNNPFSSYMRGL